MILTKIYYLSIENTLINKTGIKEFLRHNIN